MNWWWVYYFILIDWFLDETETREKVVESADSAVSFDEIGGTNIFLYHSINFALKESNVNPFSKLFNSASISFIDIIQTGK